MAFDERGDPLGGLPDSRLSPSARRRKTIVGPYGKTLDRCYCAHCGADGGAVTLDTPVFFACDKCAHIFREQGHIEVPERIVRDG